jgi:hypothetical protein
MHSFQFRDSRNINVSVKYAIYVIDSEMAAQNGKLDITVLLPGVVATFAETILSQCILSDMTKRKITALSLYSMVEPLELIKSVLQRLS